MQEDQDLNVRHRHHHCHQIRVEEVLPLLLLVELHQDLQVHPFHRLQSHFEGWGPFDRDSLVELRFFPRPTRNLASSKFLSRRIAIGGFYVCACLAQRCREPPGYGFLTSRSLHCDDHHYQVRKALRVQSEITIEEFLRRSPQLYNLVQTRQNIRSHLLAD